MTGRTRGHPGIRRPDLRVAAADMTVTNAAGYHSDDTIAVISSDTAAVAPRRGAPR